MAYTLDDGYGPPIIGRFTERQMRTAIEPPEFAAIDLRVSADQQVAANAKYERVVQARCSVLGLRKSYVSQTYKDEPI